MTAIVFRATAQLPSRARLHKVLPPPVSRKMAPDLSASATLKLVVSIISKTRQQQQVLGVEDSGRPCLHHVRFVDAEDTVEACMRDKRDDEVDDLRLSEESIHITNLR